MTLHSFAEHRLHSRLMGLSRYLLDRIKDPGEGAESGFVGRSLRQERDDVFDALVTLNEVNNRHGTGPLVRRLFRDDAKVLAIRSRNHYGDHQFGSWNAVLSQEGKPRHECFRDVIRLLAGRQIRNVICVPYYPDEIITSIAIKEVFGASLCAYIMDDQNVAEGIISDSLMREFLGKCALRLATHPELAAAYEQKFSLSIHVLPAIVPAHLVRAESDPPQYDGEEPKAALLGSFWSQTWFDRLCDVLAGSGYRIDWYGNNQSPWFRFPPEELERAGITAYGVLPEDELAAVLRRYPVVIVPVGTLDSSESNKGVASLSLPGRILFALSAAHAPLLLVGSEDTCGARFVQHFGVGAVVPYDPVIVRLTLDKLVSSEWQTKIRGRCAKLASAFSDEGVPEWLETSIRQGSPADQRFEAVFSGYRIQRDL